MSDDFSKGQEAILNHLIQKRIEAEKKAYETIARKAANEQLEAHEASKVPLWKFWKRRDALGVFAATMIVVVAFIADRTSGRAYLDTLLHDILNTEGYLANQIAEPSTKAGIAISDYVKRELNLDDESAEFTVSLKEYVDNYIEQVEAPDHPIPKAIRKIVGQRPILVFHGEAVFGQPGEVSVEFPSCGEFSRYIEEYALSNPDFNPPVLECNLSGTIIRSDSFALPFYASFWRRDAKPGHDVHLIISLQRIPRSLQEVDTYLSPYRNSIDGIQAHYVRTVDATAMQSEVDLSDAVRHLEGNFFHVDIGKIAREQYPYDPALNSEQTFLHTVELSSDNTRFDSLGEIVFVKALAFVNRKPRYVDQ